ncbi:MAG: dephospho-CoA kinase [Anaerolineaceae bacterium]|nr:dephospho-CoA kinase [Anaerolineaceae bacterium]
MAKTPYIIGLTGNIASGKSGIRQILENCGALTIDADLLAQRTYMKNAPAYQPVIEHFGEEILDINGEIDRKRLGNIVFSDPQALRHLEGIVHPHTLEALEGLLLQSKTDLIVLEVIKLFEIGLAPLCDTIWVSSADDQVRFERLIKERSLSVAEARARINTQPPQQEKIDRADLVINTEGNFTLTWEQVHEALNAYAIPQYSAREVSNLGLGLVARPLIVSDILQAADLLTIETGKPVQVEEIFRTLTKTSLLAIHQKTVLTGLISWKMVNFVSIISQWIKDPNSQTLPKSKKLLSAFQKISNLHLCEVLCVSSSAGIEMDTLKKYQYHLPSKIANPIWRAATIKELSSDNPVYYKTLKMNGKIVHLNQN